MNKEFRYYTEVIVSGGIVTAIVKFCDSSGEEVVIFNESHPTVDEAIHMANWAIILKEEELGR